MCGIAGVIRFHNTRVEEAEIHSMLDSMKHRGPDDRGTYVKDGIGLGHLRLSILDLSSQGHQPMFDETGDYCIVFNGEIYNYVELRKELEHEFSFRSQTDTEVILAAYKKWGEDCLHRFNGDWAFVIHHLPSKRIFGARDRYGIKPFYYTQTEHGFYFGSEAKSLLNKAGKSINHQALYNFLVFNRTDYSEETFYQDIFKVAHGSCFLIEDGKVTFRKWYDLEAEVSKREVRDHDVVDEFSSLLQRSVELRLRSDVPLGVSLSGGLDSSTIACLAQDKLGEGSRMNTFSAIYKGFNNADESAFIETLGDRGFDMHFTTPNAESFFQDMRGFVQAQSEPVASVGPYAQYKVMQLAKDSVKVTLDGQGADEMLAGYHYFYGSYFKELLGKGRIGKLLSEASAYHRMIGDSAAYKYFLLYLAPQGVKRNVVEKGRSHALESFHHEHQQGSNLAKELYSPRSLNESLLSHFEYKLEHLLKWEDHNAMYFSIESRVPFLDHHLVEFTLRQHSDWKIRNGQTKSLLREAMRGQLPEKIRQRRDKKGFSTPADHWFRQPELVKLVKRIIDDDTSQLARVLDLKKCQNTYREHVESKADHSKEIWKWLNLNLWLDQTKVTV